MTLRNFRDCNYCGASPADCVCEGSNDVAGYTPSGLAIDRDGLILTHLLSTEQKRAIEESLAKPINMRVRQAD